MDAVSLILKRAYRGAKPQAMPPTMVELLRKLEEQDAKRAVKRRNQDKGHYDRGKVAG